jgi:PAS domain S-box-containing protein
MDFSPTVFFVYTADRSQLLSVSADYETVWGRSCESLYQNPQSWLEAVHPDDRPQVEETLPRSAQGPVAQTYRITRPDGSIRWIASRIAPVGNPLDGSGRIIGCAEDITEQKDTEQQLQRANRALRTLSECNQLVVRASDEATLLDEICRILVEFGGYRAAWIGFAEPDPKQSVRPVAQAGYSEAYLQSIQLSWGDNDLGRGPTGIAIRTGQLCIAQDILHDSHFQPWRETALKQGYAAAISLPLMANDKAFGVLNIYSVHPHAFDANETRLLTELAGDLAYGIEALRTQTALQDSETKFRAFLEMASEAIIASNDQGNIVLFNSAAEELFGYSQADMLGQPVELLMPERFRHGHLHHREEYNAHPSRRSMGRSRILYGRRRDGTEFPVEVGLSHVDIEGERFVLTFLTDVSDRKRAEAALRQAQDELQHSNQELEHRVLQRTEELLQLNQRLQQELAERRQVEAEQRRLAAIVASSDDGIIGLALDGTVTSWNRGAEKIYGYGAEDIVGQPVQRLVPEDRLAEETSIIERIKQGERLEHYETLRRHKDGSLFDVSLTISPIKNSEGEVIGISKISRDITARKRAEAERKQAQEALARELARSKGLLDASFDGIVVIDAQGYVVDANESYARMMGRTLDETLQLHISDWDAQWSPQELDDIVTTGRFVDCTFETVHRRKDGSTYEVEITVSNVAVGDEILQLCICRDITERKRSEEQLRLSNERMSLANAELARAARLKDEFLASMSHELRTPLNAILGLAEALIEDIFGPLNDEQREHLTTIEKSGKHLLALINDILDLSKVESGRMELEITPVPVEEFCTSCLSFVKQQAHQKRIQLDCRIDPELVEIDIDERRIRQVLVNLLSNAVKFTPENGTVQLQVRGDSFRESLDFSVTDTGIGIAPEHLDKLFQPFVQIDSALSRRYAGTGLGLALVRRIAELHGGSVALESQEGKGSRFTVSLPWAPSEEHQPVVLPLTADACPWQPGLRKVLIIEDSAAAADQIMRYLKELEIQGIVYPKAAGAMDLARQAQPDVIILDILLPDQSGWTVLADLKDLPATQDIPVIVVSVVDEQLKSLDMGAVAHLLKPFTRPQFQQVLQRTIPPRATSEPLVPLAAATDAPLILLAEDNEANIAMLESYLEAQGFRVVVARNGREAVQMATQYQPDLVLMDIQMPEMDGLEATQKIRTDATQQDLPVIALTALAMPGDRERCLAVGATDYLTKPISPKHLLELLMRYIPQLSAVSQ